MFGSQTVLGKQFSQSIDERVDIRCSYVSLDRYSRENLLIPLTTRDLDFILLVKLVFKV